MNVASLQLLLAFCQHCLVFFFFTHKVSHVLYKPNLAWAYFGPTTGVKVSLLSVQRKPSIKQHRHFSLLQNNHSFIIIIVIEDNMLVELCSLAWRELRITRNSPSSLLLCLHSCFISESQNILLTQRWRELKVRQSGGSGCEGRSLRWREEGGVRLDPQSGKPVAFLGSAAPARGSLVHALAPPLMCSLSFFHLHSNPTLQQHLHHCHWMHHWLWWQCHQMWRSGQHHCRWSQNLGLSAARGSENKSRVGGTYHRCRTHKAGARGVKGWTDISAQGSLGILWIYRG